MNFPNIYNIKDYRLLAVVPLALLAIAVMFIPNIKLGVEFSGGTLISLDLEEKIADVSQLKTALEADGLKADLKLYDTTAGQRLEIELPQSNDLIAAEKLRAEFDSLLPRVSTLEVEAQQNESKKSEYKAEYEKAESMVKEMYAIAGLKYEKQENASVNQLDKNIRSAYKEVYAKYEKSIITPIDKNIKYKNISIKTVSPLLSASFIETALKVALVSAILSSLFVFLSFRTFIPSIAVITGAFCDIIIALGAMGFFGIPLTLASFAALLMIVGFSLDTDILLTSRMIKQKGDPREKAYDSMKTGLTMSIMAIISFGTLFALASITHISTYYEISSVALAGLVGDMFATWGINAVILLWYVEGKR